jgi:hypothetical protein
MLEPVGIAIHQGTIARVGITIPTLGVVGACSGLFRINTCEPTLQGRKISGPKVIQIRFSVPFFLGELLPHGIHRVVALCCRSATSAGKYLFAEW